MTNERRVEAQFEAYCRSNDIARVCFHESGAAMVYRRDGELIGGQSLTDALDNALAPKVAA